MIFTQETISHNTTLDDHSSNSNQIETEGQEQTNNSSKRLLYWILNSKEFKDEKVVKLILGAQKGRKER